MSMHYYGVHGYGLFINNDEYDSFAAAFAAAKDIEVDDIEFEIEGICLNDDTFDGREVWHLDGKPHEEDGDDFVDGFFLFCRKSGSILLNHKQYCYPDIESMANEFRAEYSAYLPKDFDYEAHLVCLTGAQYY